MGKLTPLPPKHGSLRELKAYAQQYRSKEWRQFRKILLEIVENRCQICARGTEDNVVLQVHHLSYRTGAKPWEYSFNECLAVCKGCHAIEHGIIPPFEGWEYQFVDDSGALDEECALCSNEIRYVHHLTHARWGSIEVGCDCADLLMNASVASERQTELKRRVARRLRFIDSPRWRKRYNGSWAIRHEGHLIFIEQLKDGFAIKAYDMVGRNRKATLEEAKGLLFDKFSEPAFLKWLADAADVRRAALNGY